MANQTLSTRLNVGVAQIVVPGTSSGLVSASGLTGNTTGSAIAAGFVGEKLYSPNGGNSLTAGVYANGTSLSITAGVWSVTAFAYFSGVSGFTGGLVGISTDSGSTTFSDVASSASPGAANIAWGAGNGTNDLAIQVSKYLDLASTTTYYCKIQCRGANVTCGAYLQAVRIA